MWFLAVFLWVAVGLYIFFGMSGGNPGFTEFGDAFNNVALLTFGYYGFEELTNEYRGLLVEQQWISPALFWVLVFVCIMFAQNIILASVGLAYEEVADAAKGSKPFWKIVLSHVEYHTLLVSDVLGWTDLGDYTRGKDVHSVKDQAIHQTVAQIIRDEILDGQRGEYHKWSAICHPDMQGLYTYFQNPLHWRISQRAWHWDNGDAIERADRRLKAEGDSGLFPGASEEDWRSVKSRRDMAAHFMDDERCFTKRELQVLIEEVTKCEALCTVQGPVMKILSSMGVVERGSHPLFSFNNRDGPKGLCEELFRAFKFKSTEPVPDFTSITGEKDIRETRSSMSNNLNLGPLSAGAANSNDSYGRMRRQRDRNFLARGGDTAIIALNQRMDDFQREHREDMAALRGLLEELKAGRAGQAETD